MFIAEEGKEELGALTKLDITCLGCEKVVCSGCKEKCGGCVEEWCKACLSLGEVNEGLALLCEGCLNKLFIK